MDIDRMFCELISCRGGLQADSSLDQKMSLFYFVVKKIAT